MAHFAKISEENEVLQVVTIEDIYLLDDNGIEDESLGQQYLETHNNWPAHLWIQTSINTYHNQHRSGDNSKAFRGNYAGIGHTWDADNNIFWHPKPHESFVKNTTIAQWDSPIGQPPALTSEQEADENNRYFYDWNETDQHWVLLTGPK
jgi:hypothetical protein